MIQGIGILVKITYVVDIRFVNVLRKGWMFHLYLTMVEPCRGLVGIGGSLFGVVQDACTLQICSTVVVAGAEPSDTACTAAEGVFFF